MTDEFEGLIDGARKDPDGFVEAILGQPDRVYALAQFKADPATRPAFEWLMLKLKQVGAKNLRALTAAVTANMATVKADMKAATQAQERPAPPQVDEPPELARCPDILAKVVETTRKAGLTGETKTQKTLYLCIVSRLLDRPVNPIVTGESSIGKSFLTKTVLRLHPAEAFYALTAMSERALAYSDEPLKHRMMVVYEAAALDNEFITYLVRTLLSEGEISYETVEKTAEGLRSRRIHREGPTGLVLTTTRLTVERETDTRVIFLPTDDTPYQTKAIMRAYAHSTNNGGLPAGLFDEWHDLQRWIAGRPRAVLVPFAGALADLIPPVAVRLRRDFPTLVTLIQSHALIHQLNRVCDGHDRIVATVEDYLAVRDLIGEVMAEQLGLAVGHDTKETCEAVAELKASHPGGVPTKAVAVYLNIDRSSASRRLRKAARMGFVFNNESRRGQPAVWETKADVPDDGALLPSESELLNAMGQGGVQGVQGA